MELQVNTSSLSTSFVEVKGDVSVADCSSRPLHWSSCWCTNSKSRPFDLEFYSTESDALSKKCVPDLTIALTECVVKLVKLSGSSFAHGTSCSPISTHSSSALLPPPSSTSSLLQPPTDFLGSDLPQSQKLVFELRTQGANPSARYVCPEASISAHWMQAFRDLLSRRPPPCTSPTRHAPRLGGHSRSNSNPNLTVLAGSSETTPATTLTPTTNSASPSRTLSVRIPTLSGNNTFYVRSPTTTNVSCSAGAPTSMHLLDVDKRPNEVTMSPTMQRRQRLLDDVPKHRTDNGRQSPVIHELISPPTPKSLMALASGAVSNNCLTPTSAHKRHFSVSQPPSPSEPHQAIPLSLSSCSPLSSSSQPSPSPPQQTPAKKVHIINTATSRTATSQGLRKIPGQLLARPLDMLVNVDLSCNLLSVFPDELSTVPHLQDLNLSCNRLHSLPGSAIRKFRSLKNLQVSVNFISRLPFELFHLPLLTHVSAHHCCISEIDAPRPSSSEPPSRLRVLCLNNNQLRSLPEELFLQAPNIDKLDLNDNFISKLPASTDHLLHLTELRVSHNALKELPSCLVSLPALEILDASSNALCNLPDEWSTDVSRSFPSIHELYLQKNSITTIPDCFSRLMGNCQLVDIAENLVTVLPSLEGMKKLDALFLGGNLLKSIPHLPYDSLTCLDLSRNQLRELPDLSRMPELQVFHAGHNPLEVSLSSVPSKLTELVIPCCNLTSLPHCEQTLEQLEILIVSGNTLSELPEEYVGSALHLCDIAHNRFTSYPPCLFEHELRREHRSSSLGSLQQSQQKKQLSVQVEDNLFDPTNIVKSSKEGDDIGEPQWDLGRFQSGIRVGKSETKGRRPLMEDACVAVGDFTAGAEYDILCLFDGHGGDRYSRSAAGLFTEHLSAMSCFMCDETTTVQEILEETLHGTDDSAYAKVKEDAQGSTALVTLFTRPREGPVVMHIANVGDARAVLSRGGKAIRLSEDQKPLDFDEYIRLTDMGAIVTERGRVQGVLAVARALGDKMLAPYVSATPTYQCVTVQPEDEFLILACDGVWDVLTDSKAVQVVHDALLETHSPDRAAMALRDWAFCSGSGDNISVIVVQLNC